MIKDVNKQPPYWLLWATGFGWLTKTVRALVGSQSLLKILGLKQQNSTWHVRIAILNQPYCPQPSWMSAITKKITNIVPTDCGLCLISAFIKNATVNSDDRIKLMSVPSN